MAVGTIPLSLAKRQHGIQPKPMVNSQWSHQPELCWHFPCQEQFSAKGLPGQIRVKKPTAYVVIPKPNWWNIWMLSNSWRPAQCVRQIERDRFRISTSSFCTKHVQQTQIFSLINLFLWNLKRTSTDRLEQDRPWWKNYEVYSVSAIFPIYF